MDSEKPSSSNSGGQVIAKKVWSILRIMFFMLKKGISKSKLTMDLNILLKRGNQIASKAIHGLILNHNSIICRPNDTTNNFLSPKEYEFSCSNTPVMGPIHKWRRNRYQLDDATTISAVHRVLEMLNNHEAGPTASPLVSTGLPGYGESPLARELRVTDSPFPLKDGKEEEDVTVNKAAEDFIKKFYRNLRMQKSLESPCHTWAR